MSGSKKKPTLSEIPHRLLGKGGYGSIVGPSRQDIETVLKTHRGVPRHELTVRKTYLHQHLRLKALHLDERVDRIDPSRQYLRAPVVKKDNVVVMRHQGQDLKHFVARHKSVVGLQQIFEHLHHLFLGLYLLYLSRTIHYDIKPENIVVNTLSPTDGVLHLGLIDFDLMDDDVMKAYAWYGVWPVEMYSKTLGKKRLFFDIFDAQDSQDDNSNDDDVDSTTQSILNMMDIWTKQVSSLKFLVNDPLTQHQMIDCGLAMILYNTFHTEAEMTRSIVYAPQTWVELWRLGQRWARGEDRPKNRIVKSYVDAFLRRGQTVLTSPLRWSKIDPFGLGLVLARVFLVGSSKQWKESLRGHKEHKRVYRLMTRLIHRMTHPDPSRRHDAVDILHDWISLLYVYRPSLARRVFHEIRRVDHQHPPTRDSPKKRFDETRCRDLFRKEKFVDFFI